MLEWKVSGLNPCKVRHLLILEFAGAYIFLDNCILLEMKIFQKKKPKPPGVKE
jgi:hypothetical protein